jgi:SAM-dependent methyltransferase
MSQGSELKSVAGDDWDVHWRDYASSNRFNPAQQLRQRWILQRLSAAAPGRLLDLGCGQGELLRSIRARFPDAALCGVDLSEEGIRIARSAVPEATFVAADLTVAGEPPAGFQNWATHAVCSEVLEHVDDPRRLLENVLKWMTAGCLLLVTVPGGPRSAFDRHIGHRRHFTDASLRSLLESVGLEVDRSAGMGFPFFNLYRLAVLMRGERLVDDAAVEQASEASFGLRIGAAVFDALLRLPSLPGGPLGWQKVAVARVPERL